MVWSVQINCWNSHEKAQHKNKKKRKEQQKKKDKHNKIIIIIIVKKNIKIYARSICREGESLSSVCHCIASTKIYHNIDWQTKINLKTKLKQTTFAGRSVDGWMDEMKIFTIQNYLLSDRNTLKVKQKQLLLLFYHFSSNIFA